MSGQNDRTKLVAFALALTVWVVFPGCARQSVGMANPASVFCIEHGGRLESVKEPNGERGVCVLPDGTRKDEWEYFRELSEAEKTKEPKTAP